MAIQRESIRRTGSTQTPAEHAAETVSAHGSFITRRATRFLAVVRVAIGFVFLWAFIDKTFGLGYATPSAKAWINGGSPTKGFLSGVEVGPWRAPSTPGPEPRGRTGCSWPACSASAWRWSSA